MDLNIKNYFSDIGSRTAALYVKDENIINLMIPIFNNSAEDNNGIYRC